MTEPPIMDDRPGIAFRRHLAKWRHQQEGQRQRLRQPYQCEAIGSVLNGSRKTRWNTSRAALTIVMGSLTIFTTAAAVGAQSLLLGLAAIACLTGVIALCRVELAQRQTYGKVRSFSTTPSKVGLSTSDSSTHSERVIADDLLADPGRSPA